MKNASRHAATLKSLQKKLARQHKPGDRPQLDPLRALVMGVLSENCNRDHSVAALTAFDAEFVDVNELRVATELELADLLGPRYPDVAHRSVRLRDLLMSVFDKEGRLTVDRLQALPKREQRSMLKAIPQMTPFVEAYISTVGLGQPSVPVDEVMRRYLVEQNVLEADATVEEAQRFLEAHLKAEECWTFFAACHVEAVKGAGSVKAPTGRKAPKAGRAAPAKPVAGKPAGKTKGAGGAPKRVGKRTSRQSA